MLTAKRILWLNYISPSKNAPKLELLIESGYYYDKTILDRCVEVKRILIASINTAKDKQ